MVDPPSQLRAGDGLGDSLEATTMKITQETSAFHNPRGFWLAEDCYSTPFSAQGGNVFS